MSCSSGKNMNFETMCLEMKKYFEKLYNIRISNMDVPVFSLEYNLKSRDLIVGIVQFLKAKDIDYDNLISWKFKDVTFKSVFLYCFLVLKEEAMDVKHSNS